MLTDNLPYFGEIIFNGPKDYYLSECQVENNKIRIHLFLKTKTVTPEKVETIKNILSRINLLNEQNKTYIRTNFDNNGEALDHVQFYMEELFEDELEAFINASSSESPQLQLLNQLRLKTISIFCDNNFQAGFDYALYFDGKGSNQVLAVILNANESLQEIVWES